VRFVNATITHVKIKLKKKGKGRFPSNAGMRNGNDSSVNIPIKQPFYSNVSHYKFRPGCQGSMPDNRSAFPGEPQYKGDKKGRLVDYSPINYGKPHGKRNRHDNVQHLLHSNKA